MHCCINYYKLQVETLRSFLKCIQKEDTLILLDLTKLSSCPIWYNTQEVLKIQTPWSPLPKQGPFIWLVISTQRIHKSDYNHHSPTHIPGNTCVLLFGWSRLYLMPIEQGKDIWTTVQNLKDLEFLANKEENILQPVHNLQHRAQFRPGKHLVSLSKV